MTSTTASDHGKCQWCGGHHDTVCPRVKAIEYFENRTIKRVEFHGPPVDAVSRVSISEQFGEGIAPPGPPMAINALHPPLDLGVESSVESICDVIADRIRGDGSLSTAMAQAFATSTLPE